VLSAVGAIIGVTVIVLFGERFRNWLLARRQPDESQQKATASSRRKTAERIWQRYGIVGLGLLAPLITGAPLGAALGVAMGAPTGRLLAWMSMGVILWSAILTTVGVLGLCGIKLIQ